MVLPGDGRVRGFDGVRAIAVLLVIQGHLGYTSNRYAPFENINDGVAIFFVMSGFLITGLLLREEREGGIALGRFYARRMLRLYPALLLFLGGLAIAEATGIAVAKPITYLLAATYVINYSPRSETTQETGHLWSLAVEEQFYLTWPFILRFLRRYALAIGVVVWLFSVWFRMFRIEPGRSPVFRYLIPAVSPILLGSVAALVLIPRLKSVAVARVWASPEVLLASVLLYTARAWAVVPLVSDTTSLYVLYELQRVGACLALVWICCNQRSGVVRLLETKLIAYIGRISYGVYLWQGIFVRNGPEAPQSWVHRFPANLCLSIAVAALCFELVEKRLLRLKDRLRPPTSTRSVRESTVMHVVDGD